MTVDGIMTITAYQDDSFGPTVRYDIYINTINMD